MGNSTTRLDKVIASYKTKKANMDIMLRDVTPKNVQQHKDVKLHYDQKQNTLNLMAPLKNRSKIEITPNELRKLIQTVTKMNKLKLKGFEKGSKV